jgi:cytochrome oxidase assembly protein ShyY1
LIRRGPIVATILVLAGVALMSSLGVWQLQRAKWKEALLANYARAEKLPPISFPTAPVRGENLPLFRHATGNCVRVTGRRAVAGGNRAGEPGYVQIVDCATGAEGPGMSVEVGWSKNPNAAMNWRGGLVSGIIMPDRKTRMRLVAGGSAPGLEPSKVPDVTSISAVTPAGHRGYAATWFALAAVAVIMYAIAMARRSSR